MSYGKIVESSLKGLQYYPKTFPLSIWDQEFNGVDIELFTKAIKKIRSTSDNFPTYSQVREMINTIRTEQNMTRSDYAHTLTKEEKEYADKARAIFRKWYRWLYDHTHINAEVLLEYYEGCAKDYQKLGGDSIFMQGVDGLYADADKMQRRIDGLEDRFGNKLTPVKKG